MNKYADLESKMLSVIKELSVRENKHLIIDYKKCPQCDAFLSDGINGIKGKTLVSIKYFSDINYLAKNYLRSSRFRDLVQNVSEFDKGIENLLLIVNLKISKEKKLELDRYLKNNIKKIKIFIWDYNYIEKITKDYPEIQLIYKNKSNELISSAINTYIKAPLVKEKRENFEKSLISEYKKDSLSLILGAGISIYYGLQDWNELIAIMIDTFLKEKTIDYKKDKSALVDIVKKSLNYSPLILMRLLKDYLGDKFSKVLYKSFYKNFNIEKRSELVEAIINLCNPPRIGIGLRGIINFNFDNILELELKKNLIAYIPIYQNTDKAQSNKIPIYHLHGYLPLNKSNKSHFDSIIISEESYHKQFTEPFSWQTITLLNYLRDYTCLFIGTSLLDPNLRRLLEISKTNSPKSLHYLIKLDEWSNKISDFKLANAFKFLEENSLRSLGVLVIWVKEYSEIPGLLRKIKAGS